MSQLIQSFKQNGVDAVAKSFVEKLRERISVSDFGNEYGNIQKAIDSVTSPYGAVINLDCIEHFINQPIVLKNHIVLQGDMASHGEGGSLIKAMANMRSMVTHDLDQTMGASGTLFSSAIRDVNLHANKDNYSIDYVIEARMVQCRIERTRIQKSTGIGIWCREFGATGFDWINWITDCSIGGHSIGGIRCEMTDSKIQGNYISGNGDATTGDGYGIMMIGGGNSVSNNQIERNGVGFAGRRSDVNTNPNCRLTNNYFDYNFHAMTLSKLNPEQSGGYAPRYMVVGNTFHRSGNLAIDGSVCYDVNYIDDSDGCVFVGNNFTSDNVAANIKMRSGTTFTVISNNMFENDVPIIGFNNSPGARNAIKGNVSNGAGKFSDGGLRTLTPTTTLILTHSLFAVPVWVELQFEGNTPQPWKVTAKDETTITIEFNATFSGAVRWKASVFADY